MSNINLIDSLLTLTKSYSYVDVMKVILVVFLFVLGGSHAQAALIKWDAFSSGDGLAVKDTSTNTIWLKLSVTAGLAYEQAISLYSDWQGATNADVENLLASALPSFLSSNTSQYQNQCYVGQSCFAESEQFLTVFGFTAHPQNDNVIYGFGQYRDEDNILRMAGARINYVLNNAYLYGDEFTSNYNSLSNQPIDTFYSTFLTFTGNTTVANFAVVEPKGIFWLVLIAAGIVLVTKREQWRHRV